jgi:glycosyltransferase involved in cell wall biosynthesis
MSERVPRISVGMPVYNGGRYLGRSIDSILGQTVEDLELVISDNASTDRSEDVCRDAAAADPRVRYTRNAQNIGAAANYNAVFHRARAAYFKWTSASDLCEATLLERCAAVLDARPDAVLCYPRTRLFDETTGTMTDYVDGLDLQDDDPVARFIACQKRMRLNNVMNGVVRRDALRRTRLMGSFLSADCCMIVELALHGKFVEVPEFLYYRRMEPQTATRLKSADEVREHWDPRSRAPITLPGWKMAREYYGAVWRAPLSLAQRARLSAHLLRWTGWARAELAGELHDALTARGRRRARSGGRP